MPIRFRCAYCNQLMGISRRKAGTIVRCPKCGGEIIVPSPEEEAPGDELANPVNQAFEDKAFDQILSIPDGSEPHSTAGVIPPMTATPPETRPGVFLPLSLLVMLGALAVVLLPALFVIGFLVGRSAE